MIESAIRLFKAVPVTANKTATHKVVASRAAKTVGSGYVFSPEVVAEYSQSELDGFSDTVNSLYGINGVELNQAFHKSFAKVRDASLTQLVIEQLVHYVTTYGFESLGLYNPDTVYVPAERLDVPELEGSVPLVVIRGMTKEELKEELLTFLAEGVALAEQTVQDAVNIAVYVGVDTEDLTRISNREVSVALHEHLGLVPANPVEFLRFVVYRATESALLIKNPATVAKIKQRDNNDVARYFWQYERDHGLARLAEIFFRFKPLFLAFRTNKELKKTINRVRRLADQNHKPMKEDLLNTLTARIRSGRMHQTMPEEFNSALESASVFRLARLMYALRFYGSGPESVVYRIRNGKSWATDLNPVDGRTKARLDLYEAAVRVAVTDKIRNKVEGKKIYIPDQIEYALPATEKQFTGNLPSGSWLSLESDGVFGIHWKNTNRRIDLDLSMVNATGKLGWDGGYRTGTRDVLFSGDVTDAPGDGATEVFRIDRSADGVWILEVNYYNFSEDDPVPFKIVAASSDSKSLSKNYVIDPNEIIAVAATEIDVKQKTLGMVVARNEQLRFYFTEMNLGGHITSRFDDNAKKTLNYLVSMYTNPVSLNDVLSNAGAVMVDSPEDADLNLSPETVDKSTFLDLLS